MEEKKGIILKGIGGFYYVESANEIYESKARGIFRKNNITPCAGDIVSIYMDKNNGCVIDKIFERKNYLIRPPVANVDNLFIVVSTKDPYPNILNIDKMIAIAVNAGIAPIIVISKCDLGGFDRLKKIYDLANIKNVVFSSVTGEGKDELKEMLKNKINVFIGNSGVGKSSLLNCLYENLSLETGKISKKLGRGKHTTRQAELFKLSNGGYVADTPGFSTLDVPKYGLLNQNDLQYCFKDIAKFSDKCKFNSCTHTCEKGCAVINAVNQGLISKTRFESYIYIYKEIKESKKW